MAIRKSIDTVRQFWYTGDMSDKVQKTLKEYAPHAHPHPRGNWPAWLAAWRAPDLCPRCGGALMRRKGRRGAFLSCNHYRDTGCKYTRDAPPLDTSARAEKHARYLRTDEKAKASQDKKDKRAAKRAAKARKAAKGKKLQRVMVEQLPVEGFDYSEWGELWKID